jgi:hypothetical protein
MEASAVRRADSVFPDPRPEFQDEPRLDGVELAALAFREWSLGDRSFLEAYGIDRDGVSLGLTPSRRVAGTPVERVALFASLLARGLRSHGPVLVDAAGCAVLRRRIAAAWGSHAVFVG